MKERLERLEKEIQRLGDKLAVIELMFQSRTDLVMQCLDEILTSQAGEGDSSQRTRLEEGFRLAVHHRLLMMEDKERAALLLAAFDPAAREINDLLRDLESGQE